MFNANKKVAQLEILPHFQSKNLLQAIIQNYLCKHMVLYHLREKHLMLFWSCKIVPSTNIQQQTSSCWQFIIKLVFATIASASTCPNFKQIKCHKIEEPLETFHTRCGFFFVRNKFFLLFSSNSEHPIVFYVIFNKVHFKKQISPQNMGKRVFCDIRQISRKCKIRKDALCVTNWS